MNRKKTITLILIILACMFLYKNFINTKLPASQLSNQNILINFDNKRIWGTSPEDNFIINLSTEHKTEGKYCLEANFPIADFPSINTHQFNHSWGTYNYLTFDVYNPQNETTNFALRLDDHKNSRFNISYPLPPGLTQVKIPRSQIAALIDPENIDFIVLFIIKPQKSYKLFFDNMQLL